MRDPIRVFLLSDDQLLSEMLRSAFRKQPGILLVGSHSISGEAASENLKSACDVLLLSPSNDIDPFETHLLLATLKQSNEHSKLITMSMDDGIADLVSSIRASFAEVCPTMEALH